MASATRGLGEAPSSSEIEADTGLTYPPSSISYTSDSEKHGKRVIDGRVIFISE